MVVVDNSAVAWALRSGFTTNEEGSVYLERIERHLDKLQILQVVSDDNPADCWSRFSSLEFCRSEYDVRCSRMYRAWWFDLVGIRVGRPAPYEGNPEGKLRHDAPEDAEMVTDNIVLFEEREEDEG